MRPSRRNTQRRSCSEDRQLAGKSNTNMKAIVTGMIATYPVGGVAWDYGQYALGLERLGFEVYYLEDTGGQTYDPIKGCYGDDCAYAVDFLGRTLAEFSPTLGDRWHFRGTDG